MLDPLSEDVARVAAVIRREGGEPGNSIHGWRCEHPDRYGPCRCVDELAELIVAELRQADA